jgi:hypothetical protein
MFNTKLRCGDLVLARRELCGFSNTDFQIPAAATTSIAAYIYAASNKFVGLVARADEDEIYVFWCWTIPMKSTSPIQPYLNDQTKFKVISRVRH